MEDEWRMNAERVYLEGFHKHGNKQEKRKIESIRLGLVNYPVSREVGII
jgi:hypothetical protein